MTSFFSPFPIQIDLARPNVSFSYKACERFYEANNLHRYTL